MRLIIAGPIIAILVYRAYSQKSLTPLGILAAIATAIIHAIHPWSISFVLLCVFFLAGTTVTKIKHDVKARLTLSTSGSAADDSARTHIQVLANSSIASILLLSHLHQSALLNPGPSRDCFQGSRDYLIWGVLCNYAAVSADTFSSELGILSRTNPRLITSCNLRHVPPGTNGGVTLLGTLAGFLGSLIIGLASAACIPLCGTATVNANLAIRSKVVLLLTVWGGLGSLVDSLLGGWLQASVIDKRTGKIVEGHGGQKVSVTDDHQDTDDAAKQKPSGRQINSGLELLDNNGVNLLMACLMATGGMTFSTLIS